MSPLEPDSQAVRAELTRVLASPGFARNERLSRFLRFLVDRHIDGRDEEIKESLIAVEVFGRKPDYDPKLDSIVRTEAGRLRSRLTEYYASEGIGDPISIDIPKGGYVPVFRHSGRVPHASGLVTNTRGNRFQLTVALVALSMVATGVGWWRIRATEAPIRIAVLPLNNLSPDPANNYFADGLTDEIITNLSVIEGLAVRSRTSSFAFKGKFRNIREAADQLDVDYILEGSVVRAGDRVRITTQLVRVRDDIPLWSQRFDRAAADMFAVQDEISLGVVNNLRLQLGRGRRRYETSVEAYDLYLRARAVKQHPPEMFQSLELFEQVIAKDPSFAPAYAGLASVGAIRSMQFPVDHPADELPKMRAAAERAIELDPLLAEAHDALAMVDAREGRWQDSEKSFRHAIELDPNRSKTNDDFGMWLLLALGRNEEAVQQLRLAERADPLSDAIHLHLGLALMSAGRFDEAATSCQKLPAEDVTRSPCLARAWLGRGDLDKALQLLESARDLGTNPQTRGFLGYAYARSGRREEAGKRAAASHYANEQALIFAGLGDKDRALEALNRMSVLGATRVGVYLNYPEFALVREDPRARGLRQKLGLPN